MNELNDMRPERSRADLSISAKFGELVACALALKESRSVVDSEDLSREKSKAVGNSTAASSASGTLLHKHAGDRAERDPAECSSTSFAFSHSR